MSFYDAPVKGPKLNPKVVLLIILSFAVIIMIIDHFVAAI